MLLIKPPDTNREIYMKILSRLAGVDEKLFDSLENYMGEQFYYILSMFAGTRVTFPSIEEINSLGVKIDIYNDMKDELPVDNLNELLEELGEKYKLQPNAIYNAFKEISDKMDDKKEK